jgi:hypothetical protein
MRAAAAVVATLAGLAALVVPTPASAWERSQGLGIDVGTAMLSVNNEATQTGIQFGLHYSLRLTDQFDFVTEAACGVVDLDPIVATGAPLNRPQYVWNADAGVIYKLDIVQFVPYFGVLGGAYYLAGGSLPSAMPLPGGEVAVGGDYLLTRRWAVGLSIREHFLFTELGTYPSYLTVTARVEVNWGGK